jgi:hypothetical protein
MTAVLLASLPIVGVAVGAILQYLFSRNAEDRKHLLVLRREAYADYLRAVAAVGFAKDRESILQARAALAQTKARIAIYGTQSAVAALARFEETDCNLKHQSACAAFVTLATCMRESDPVSPTDLRLVLLGAESAEVLPNRPLQQSWAPQ